uniref:EMAP like 4 n=1 Tax=Esox lucius TaxID=8010 RepID=A0A3P9A660_ESOLU
MLYSRESYEHTISHTHTHIHTGNQSPVGFAIYNDSISAASASDVQDRLSSLELRVQQQEDEITVMKAALADVLRRLALSEDTAAKKQTGTKGQTPLREAYSMSCIANGSTSSRKPSHRDRDGSTVSVARKETFSSAAKSGPTAERKKDKPQMEGIKEKEEESSPASQANDKAPAGSPVQPSPSPSSSSHPPSPHPPQSQRQTPEGKGTPTAKRFFIYYIKMFMRGRPITMFIPSDVENYEDVRSELPPERLKLEWVYGYRGRDCRANVYLLPTGESLYFIASVVVLFNYEERTQRHYLGHTDCVKCVHFPHLPKPLQPHVRVWDSVSLSTLQVLGLGTFERGVGSLAFSKADSGTHLAVIDDCNDHMLTVWDWQKKSKIAEIKSTNEVVLAVEFHPTDANTIVTCGKSHIFFWTWAGTSLARKQGIFGKYEKPKFIQCLAFLSNGDILTGDSGGIMLIWTRSTVEPAPGKGPKGAYQISRQIKAHDGSVFTLCQMRNGTLLTGGGKDHKIILWDHDLNPERDIEVPDQYGTIRAVAEGKGDQFLVGTSRNFILRGTFNDGFQVEVQGHTDELWGLASHPFKDLFLTCGQDRQVCLWNAADHSLEWTRLLDEHGHCADFHPSGAVVAIGTHSGKWYALDAETRDLVAIHTDGNEQLSVMRFSVDGTLLAVGSHDNFIYLYTVSEKGRKYTRFGKCIGHSSYITHLDWSPDNKFVMSNSGDYEILYWDIPNGCKYIRNRSECKDIDWATYTCVLGYHVFGVWPEGSDGTDINALIRSHNRKVIALADDFCKVHLFQYPCSRPKAPSHKYSAHSSHVTNVTFLHNDSHLVSTGGKDTSVMQWRLVEKTSSLVPSDSSLALGEGLMQNSAPRPALPVVSPTPTPPTVLDLTSDPVTAVVTPPTTPTKPTTNGRQESSPETPPPSELTSPRLDSTPPPSDSTLSPKDSLDPSDDTATPSDEGRPFTPPS